MRWFPRRIHPRRQQPPQALALGAALVYAVVVGAGASAIAARPPADPDPGPSAYPVYTTNPYTTWSTPPLITTTTTVPPTSADGPLVTVSGASNLTVLVPRDWSATSRSSTLREAIDPADPVRLIRYGGAPPTEAGGLLDRIDTANTTAAGRRAGYQLLRLEATDFHAADAVVWEFQYVTEAGVTLHCSGHYWMAGGVEYVLYAQSRPADWAATEFLLRRMIDSAGPVR